MTKLFMVDYGMFTSVAERLTRDFDEVLYYMPWKKDFPNINDYMIGRGLDGVTRVDDFWSTLKTLDKKQDTIMFTDIYDGDWQTHLRDHGYAVWGSGFAQDLEIDRYETRVKMNDMGFPVPETHYIKGVSSLRLFLKDKSDLWVKISKFRGCMETFRHIDYSKTNTILNELENKYGIGCDMLEFIVDEPIEAKEYGYDGFCIDGKFPEIACYGWEIKDVCYTGHVCHVSQMPWQLSALNDKISSLLVPARGDFSNEVRGAKDGTPYLLDPTPRKPSPPTQCLQEAYSNWGEIIEGGARGELVTPKPVAKFVAEAFIYSMWSREHWNHVTFPEKHSQWIKLRNHCKVDGDYYIVPRDIPSEIVGAVVGIGNTLQEAIDAIKEHGEEVYCIDKDLQLKGLDEALQTVEEAKEYGIHFPVK